MRGGDRASAPPLSSAYHNGSTVSLSTSVACTPQLLSYNVNSLSYYASSEAALRRKGRVLEALGDFVRAADIICLQETNLAPQEKLALTHLSGCTISHNNFDSNKAGTLIIDTPGVKKFFMGADVPIPQLLKGHIQLRRYTPKDPARSPFQVFNFYQVWGRFHRQRQLPHLPHGGPALPCAGRSSHFCLRGSKFCGVS